MFYHHTYSTDRAYLITNSKNYWYTTDTGKTWNSMPGPLPPNNFGLPILHFHPAKSDWLIWSGSEGCSGFGENCHVEAWYTRDNGRNWVFIEKYVRNCAWARDSELKVDPAQIICEVYGNQEGNQRFFAMDNPLQLIGGTDYFSKKTKLFNHVVGFAKFNEFLIVAEVGRPKVLQVLIADVAHSTSRKDKRLTYRCRLMGGRSRLGCSLRMCDQTNMSAIVIVYGVCQGSLTGL